MQTRASSDNLANAPGQPFESLALEEITNFLRNMLSVWLLCLRFVFHFSLRHWLAKKSLKNEFSVLLFGSQEDEKDVKSSMIPLVVQESLINCKLHRYFVPFHPFLSAFMCCWTLLPLFVVQGDELGWVLICRDATLPHSVPAQPRNVPIKMSATCVGLSRGREQERERERHKMNSAIINA